MAGDLEAEGTGVSVVELPGRSSQRYEPSAAEVKELDKFTRTGALAGWFARWGRVMVDVRRKDGRYLVLRSHRDVQSLLAGLNSAAKAPGRGNEDTDSSGAGSAPGPRSGPGVIPGGF